MDSKAVANLAAVAITALFTGLAARAVYHWQTDNPNAPAFYNTRTMAREALEKKGMSGIIIGESTSIWCPDNYNLMGQEFTATASNGNVERGVVCLDTQKTAKIVQKQSLFQ